MQCSFTDSFNKQLQKLPATTQAQVTKQTELLIKNKRHPSLHCKKLIGESDVYSIRIAGRYRALFILTSDTYIFFAIGHRKDIYR